MDKLEAVLGRLPSFYNTTETSNMYGLMKSFTDELQVQLDSIDRADDMIGISSTRGSDLEYRWGNILGFPRISNETDDQYRARLKNSVQTMVGGTKSSIQFAVGVGLGISTDQTKMDDMIHIYDAWDYNVSEVDPAIKTPCNVICYIDLMNEQYYDSEIDSIVRSCTNASKAAGIDIHIIVANYKLDYYVQMDDVTYEQLSTLRYSQMGG